MKKISAVLMTACVWALAGAMAATGQGRGQGRGEGHGEGHGHGGDRHESHGRRSYSFTTRDQGIIRRYLREHASSLPPGLAKRGGHLPPGLERQIERNGTLPPGLQKRMRPFPERLNRELPPLPSGYSRVIISGKALVLSPTLRIVASFSL